MGKSNRRHYRPEKGTIYRNHGGGTFRCLEHPTQGHIGAEAWMQNTASGWTFQARGIHRYEDGSIDWDYSVDGHFEEVRE